MRTTALRATLVAYVAVLAVPLAGLAPDPTLPVLATCALLGALAGLLSTARIDPQEWFETWTRALAGFVPPVAWFGLALATGPTPAGVALSAWFVGAAAVVPWLLAIALAAHCQTQDRIEAATTELTYEARPPSAVNREYKQVGAVLLGLVALGVVVSIALGGFDEMSVLTWLPTMTVVWIVLLDGQDARSVRITDAGLVAQSTLHGWDTIESFSLDDEELAISRKSWYHSELRYDREDIDDLDAVVAALSKYVPQD